jgi:hypothetical protein
MDLGTAQQQSARVLDIFSDLTAIFLQSRNPGV